MTDAFKQQIQAEARQAVEELLEQAKLKKGDVFVVGCSSSEIVGGHIGKDSSLEAAQAVYAALHRCWPSAASGWRHSAVST